MAFVDALGQVRADPTDLQLRTIWVKRSVDVALSLPLCLMALPVIATLALLLALQLRTNPFFVHDRIGRGGKVIRIPKLRTLVRDTDPYADKTKVPIEPPTGLALRLRRLHLDELPQLFLVPLGRMSLVGPRPRMVIEAREHDDSRYEALRTSIDQGCTGLWQISSDKTGRVSDHPEYDDFYIAQRTVRLDLWILWRTVLQTLGAHTITFEDIPGWALREPNLALRSAPT